IGRNGHIGFNEPGEVFVKDTHVVDLTESTIDANKRFFASADDVPKQALSMGIGTIMHAKTVLLLASGKDKAEAIKNSFFGPVTPKCQGSILQFHGNVIVVCDEDAYSLCK
ncbi:MAG: glucosamine-6-phosphate deaminase, partial [Lachnospiraceae bacterium]|nr:glucosamine-6-phosphate deaminase [Lachnospiraceae bacterium]